jgi:hypothetical protein
MDQIEILDPVFYATKGARRTAPPLADLRGKRFGLWNSTGWPNLDIYLDRLTELIGAEYGPAAVVRETGPDGRRGQRTAAVASELLDRFAAAVDCAVMGICA